MSTVVKPLKLGESPDAEVNALLQQAKEGWWNDTAMFGVIARQPELLKKIVPVFEAFFLAGRIPKRLYGTASSPSEGVIRTRPYG